MQPCTVLAVARFSPAMSVVCPASITQAPDAVQDFWILLC